MSRRYSYCAKWTDKKTLLALIKKHAPDSEAKPRWTKDELVAELAGIFVHQELKKEEKTP